MRCHDTSDMSHPQSTLANALVFIDKKVSVQSRLGQSLHQRAIRLFVQYFIQYTSLKMRPVLKDNSTMSKTEAQLVSYGILYLNPSFFPSANLHTRSILLL